MTVSVPNVAGRYNVCKAGKTFFLSLRQGGDADIHDITETNRAADNSFYK
jgi:hypothetical protein